MPRWRSRVRVPSVALELRTTCCVWFFFCAYNEPNTDFCTHADLCLHKDLHGCENLYLANVHHRAAKRDGVCSPGVRGHTKPWLITNVKYPLAPMQICACTRICMGAKICIWRMYIIELLSEMVGVRSPGVRVHTKPWLITNVKKTGIEPVFHHNYSFFISGRTSILQMQQLR